MAVTTVLEAHGSSFASSISTGSFTVSSGEGLVFFVVNGDSSASITGATWNGASMGTAVYNNVPAGQSTKRVAVFAMATPTTGTGVCTVSMSGNASTIVGAVVVAGHNTTSMLRDLGSGVYVTTSGGTLSSPYALSNTISSATNDLVLDMVGGYYGTSGGTAGAGQTEVLDFQGVNSYSMMISKEGGAPTTTMSWTMAADFFYTHTLLSIQPAGGGSSYIPRATLLGAG